MSDAPEDVKPRPELIAYMGRLYEARQINNERPKDKAMADMLGIDATTLHRLKRGYARPRSKVVAIARAGGLPVSEFLWANGYAPEKEELEADKKLYGTSIEDADLLRALAHFGQVFDSNTMPVYGSVACGSPEHRDQEEPVEFMEEIGAKYLLRASGDSMDPFVKDGEVVAIRPSKEPKVGQIVIALVGSESVCKKLRAVEYVNGGAVYTLEPANSKYGAIKETEVQFQGIVLGRYTSF